MKLYDKYKELKNINNEKMYLFKNGNFYIFLSYDADKINEYVVLKKTQFNKEVMKCGFPKNSIDDYMKVFHNHKLDIEIIDDENNDPLKLINNLSLDKITPIQALNILYELKELTKWIKP